jgi:hypothetical protein
MFIHYLPVRSLQDLILV